MCEKIYVARLSDDQWIAWGSHQLGVAIIDTDMERAVARMAAICDAMEAARKKDNPSYIAIPTGHLVEPRPRPPRNLACTDCLRGN